MAYFRTMQMRRLTGSLQIVAIVKLKFACYRLELKNKHGVSFAINHATGHGYLTISLANDITSGRAARFHMVNAGGKLDVKR